MFLEVCKEAGKRGVSAGDRGRGRNQKTGPTLSLGLYGLLLCQQRGKDHTSQSAAALTSRSFRLR